MVSTAVHWGRSSGNQCAAHRARDCHCHLVLEAPKAPAVVSEACLTAHKGQPLHLSAAWPARSLVPTPRSSSLSGAVLFAWRPDLTPLGNY